MIHLKNAIYNSWFASSIKSLSSILGGTEWKFKSNSIYSLFWAMNIYFNYNDNDLNLSEFEFSIIAFGGMSVNCHKSHILSLISVLLGRYNNYSLGA